MMKNFFYIIIVGCSASCFGMDEIRDLYQRLGQIPVKEPITSRDESLKDASVEASEKKRKSNECLGETDLAWLQEQLQALNDESYKVPEQVKRNRDENKFSSNTKEQEKTKTEKNWNLLSNTWVRIGLAAGIGYFVWKYFVTSKKQSPLLDLEATTK